MDPSGHLWTVGKLLERSVATGAPPESRPWSTTVGDPVSGEVPVTGSISRPVGARDLVVLIHGLGGSSESRYLIEAAVEAWSLGIASLRLNLRGADGGAADFYHGGLTTDLAASVEDLARSFERVFVLGFSLGGHVALRYATEVEEGAVSACAAVCSPLDLGAAADAIDQRSRAPYRWYVLRHLKQRISVDAAVRFGIDLRRLRSVTRLREWDALTVVPRFGFRDTDDYYRKASVGTRLRHLRRPSLLVAAENDPMIPPGAIRPRSEAAGLSRLTVRWLPRGGHVALPARADLGLGSEAEGRSPVAQILCWLRDARDAGERSA